jgi:hypothetical protein
MKAKLASYLYAVRALMARQAEYYRSHPDLRVAREQALRALEALAPDAVKALEGCAIPPAAALSAVATSAGVTAEEVEEACRNFVRTFTRGGLRPIREAVVVEAVRREADAESGGAPDPGREVG